MQVLPSGHPGELKCRCGFPFPSSTMSLLFVLLLESDYTSSRASDGLEHLAYAMGGIVAATSYRASQFPTLCGTESRAIHELPSRSENGKLEEGRGLDHS